MPHCNIEQSGDNRILCVSKIDAGIAIILTDDMQTMEIPTNFLPPGIAPGSFITIHTEYHKEQEKRADLLFASLQSEIADLYGRPPEPPVLSLMDDRVLCRAVLNGNIVHHLEWYYNTDNLLTIANEDIHHQSSDSEFRAFVDLSTLKQYTKSGLSINIASSATMSNDINADVTTNANNNDFVQICLKTSSGPFWSNKLPLYY